MELTAAQTWKEKRSVSLKMQQIQTIQFLIGRFIFRNDGMESLSGRIKITTTKITTYTVNREFYTQLKSALKNEGKP